MLCMNFSYSQSFSIEWSELMKKRGTLVYLLPSTDNEFFALRWSGGRLLGHYQVSHHKNLQLTSTGKIKLVADKSMANFEGARVIDGRFTVFLSDRKDGFNHFYMQPYGDDLMPIGEPIAIASYRLDKGTTKGWFDIKMSANKKHFGVVWEIPGRRDVRTRYGFKIFDLAMNEINEGDYPLPFDAALSKIHSHHISNQGEYFMAITEFEENDSKKIFDNSLEFKALHIYHIAEDGLQDFTLDIEGKRVEAMAMTSDSEEIFIITGIYGEADEGGVKGVFHQQVDLKSGQTLSQGFRDFGDEFITQGWSDRAKKRADRREERGKGDPALYNYQMREAIIQSDGSIIGTMEQYYIQTQNFSDTRTGQVSNSYYYYYNDIIAYKINTEGEFEWLEKIRKYQVSTNDGGPYSSYESFLDGNKMYFIFNDNVDNYDSDGNYLEQESIHVANYGRRRNAVAISEIDLLTGEQKRKTFFNRSEVSTLAVPKMFEVSYESSQLLIYTIYGNREKIGRLSFDK